MSLITCDFQLNHIFFFLVFISYFIREYLLYSLKLNSDNIASARLFKIYLMTISNLFSVFLVCISYIINSRRKKEKIQKTKNNIELIHSKPIKEKILLIRTFLVSFCFFISQYLLFILYIFIGRVKAGEIESLSIFYLIFIYMFSKIMQKVQYYKHHYLSFIINLIFFIFLGSIDCQHLYKNREEKLIYYIIVLIIFIALNSFSYVLGKKALTTEFLSPQSILLYIGIYQLILAILFSIPFIFIKLDIFNIFIKVFNDFNNIIICILCMIVECAYYFFLWIINDRFSPNTLALALMIKGLSNKIFDYIKRNIIEKKDQQPPYKTILEFITYIILIIGSSIHSEFIIINACELNKYTKKNLNNMGYEDYNLTLARETRDSSYRYSLNEEDEEEKIENETNVELLKK